MLVTFGGDDGKDEDVPMQEDGACTYQYQGGDGFNFDIYDYDHDCRILLQEQIIQPTRSLQQYLPDPVIRWKVTHRLGKDCLCLFRKCLQDTLTHHR